ncbi:hypothetical protein GCM10010168_69790 [Actinoplanes ianthinogenes]|uniref:YD repeat-containing protein n=1 Tax=Actinoplanes ianthinogenes TaxID=122358 RepID=A0ABN6CIT0_9ACTN|nr:hypothetical protein [Actinoplanes ianthinogenes]BCJ45178.1 hypothetical protein Aiant_58350 [Actinoplanes ianthinogenes]GGR41092.1 hypothetical protein GCM10010168_69790 [Actinoplanes ianthinogenes]
MGEQAPFDDQGIANPYSDQTKANTHTPWLADGPPVDVDLDGLREYAKLMMKAQLDLSSRRTHLSQLFELPVMAWDGDVLGEAAAVRSQMSANASEFNTYLANLGQSLMNIGSAAQTIADIYEHGDATSAASLNDVLFAFGDKSVPRPHGLPSYLGKTYADAMAEGAKEGGAAADSAEWVDQGTVVNGPYHTLQTSVANGQRRTVETMTIPNTGTTVVTTTVYDKKGNVVSTFSTRTETTYDSRTNTQTTTETTTAGKTVTGSSTSVKTYANGEVVHEVTTSKDGSGTVTGQKSTDVNRETGVRTDVTRSADTSTDDKNDLKETDRVVYGKETKSEKTVTKEIAEDYYPEGTRG